MEGRYADFFDLPGAYLHSYILKDRVIIFRLRGDSIGFMCEVNPEHKKSVIYKNEKKVLCLRVVRAIYACIGSALFGDKLYYETLHKNGFSVNPYDRFVGNKAINGNQCTL